MKIYIYFFIIFNFFVFSSQDIYIGLPSPYGNALAGASTASVSGVEALTINPANLTENDNYRIDFSFAHSFYILNTTYSFISSRYQDKNGFTYGLGFAFFNSGKMVKALPGSLTEDSDGYYTSKLSGESFSLSDYILILAAAYDTLWDITPGIALKSDISVVDQYNNFSLLFDIGLTYHMFQNLYRYFNLNKKIFKYFIPQKISFALKDYGLQVSFIKGNNPGKYISDIRCGVYFDPFLPLKYYDMFYTVEFSKYGDIIFGLGNTIKIKNFATTILTGFNIKEDSATRFACGLHIKSDIFHLPMEIGYSFRILNRFKIANDFYYKISWDTLSKVVQKRTVINKLKKYIKSGNYKKAYNYAKMQRYKYPNLELDEIFRYLKILLAKDKEMFFLTE